MSIDNYEKGEKLYDSLGRTTIDSEKDEVLGYRQGNSGFGGDVFRYEEGNTEYDDLDEFIDKYPELFANKRETYADYKRKQQLENTLLKEDGDFSIQSPMQRAKGKTAQRKKKHYWHTGLSKTEINYIIKIAEYEVDKSDKYISSGNKWLYDNRKETPYFALYSTTDKINPTILYAGKGKRAKFEHQILIEHFEEEVDSNEYINTRAKVIDEILSNYRHVVSRENVHRDNTVGRGSNDGDAGIYSENSRNRPSEAFINCLANIAKIQAGNTGIEDSNQESYENNDDQFSVESPMQRARRKYK